MDGDLPFEDAVRSREGEYGYCVSCGEPIAPKRLELDPATPLCLSCAERSG